MIAKSICTACRNWSVSTASAKSIETWHDGSGLDATLPGDIVKTR